jgi:DNA-binding transcriptional ArsR family regulator
VRAAVIDRTSPKAKGRAVASDSRPLRWRSVPRAEVVWWEIEGAEQPCRTGRFDKRLDTTIWLYQMQIALPDFDRMFSALADATRRDIVRRAIVGEEGVAQLAEHYPMSFAAVQKHIAILERAGMVTKERIGRRKVVRTNLERLRVARRLLDQYEELWRGRVARMTALVTDDITEERNRMTALVTDNTKEQDR